MDQMAKAKSEQHNNNNNMIYSLIAAVRGVIRSATANKTQYLGFEVLSICKVTTSSCRTDKPLR